MTRRGRAIAPGFVRLSGAALLAVGLAGPAAAQVPVRDPEAFAQPLFLRVIPDAGRVSQQPAPPLAPALAERLRRAQALRDAGRLDRARDSLEALLPASGRHPLVVTELGRVYLARAGYSALERLARAERLARHDSLLLARELAQALERLARPREAAQVAVEAWVAVPGEADWAQETVLRLATADPRGVRETVERAAARRPARADLATGAARLAWKTGEGPAALRLLAAAERAATPRPLRLAFAEELLGTGVPRDSSEAIEALLDFASDAVWEPRIRTPAARRAWTLFTARGAEADGAPRVLDALRDLPPAAWDPELALSVARGLRQAGSTAAARELLEPLGALGNRVPEMALERALADLRDGPPVRALPALAAAAAASSEGAYRYAEALLFAGDPDSALAVYQGIAEDPRGRFAGAALERIYLIEDAEPREALIPFGRVAYEEWRGERLRAQLLADSLYQALPRGPMWAQVALTLARLREAGGPPIYALEPLLAVADSLPDDRLAPLARQRAGDIYRTRLKDDRRALEQYEECLARYPRAWNAAEVRRQAEQLRRDRRL